MTFKCTVYPLSKLDQKDASQKKNNSVICFEFRLLFLLLPNVSFTSFLYRWQALIAAARYVFLFQTVCLMFSNTMGVGSLIISWVIDIGSSWDVRFGDSPLAGLLLLDPALYSPGVCVHWKHPACRLTVLPAPSLEYRCVSFLSGMLWWKTIADDCTFLKADFSHLFSTTRLSC